MLPVQITVRDIPISPALETTIRKHADKLKQYNNRITSCRVVIEIPQKHKHQGKLFNVRIDLTIPRKELVATHKYDQDVYIAIRDAFDAIIRQLEEYSRKRHGRVKSHNPIMHGHVIRLFSEEGYGFIKGVDGNEYYFSFTNVHHPRRGELTLGDAVEYIAEQQDEGLQAYHIVQRKNHVPH